MDVRVKGCWAYLWVKDPARGRVRLLDRYRPDFYIEPRGVEPDHLWALLEEKDDLPLVAVEERTASIADAGRRRVLRVEVEDVERYRRVVSFFERSSLAKTAISSGLNPLDLRSSIAVMATLDSRKSFVATLAMAHSLV